MPQERKFLQNVNCIPSKKHKCRIDAAGKLFTFSASKKIPCVYRFWATMKELVDVSILQKALINILKRFPYYHVKLSRGFFWYKWKKADDYPQIEKELDYPCKYIPIRNGKTFPYRIIANQNQIIIEFFHGLTDGFGALQFLRSLICEYLVLKGYTISDWNDIMRPDQEVKKEEGEYAYRKNFKFGIPKLPKVYRAFHLPFGRMDLGVTYVTSGKVNVNDILKVSKGYNVTLTEFLTAVYIDVLQDILFDLSEKKFKKHRKPIRIMVPINTRKIIPSKTMRNFTTFIAPGIDPRLGKFSFDEIIDQVHYFKNLNINRKSLLQQIAYYIGLETNLFIAAAPYFLKLLLVKPLYRKLGEALFSAFLTNLGKTTLPVEIADHVKDIQIVPMNHPYFKTGVGLLTYFDDLNINFVRNIKEDFVEEKFFSKLRDFGLDVKVTRLF